MQNPATMLLVSTNNDPSLNLFSTGVAASLIKPVVITYEATIADLPSDYTYIYFRDPFNDSSIDQKSAQIVTLKIIEKYSSAYFIDNITSYDDMLLEDKWLQYQRLSKYMPHTELLRSLEVDTRTHFVKKRISSRSKGIIFTNSDFPTNAKATDYIIQPKLNIRTEYRAYVVGGRLVRPIATKSSKTAGQKVKIIGVTDKIDPQIIAICNAVYKTMNYDLMGLDIAKTDDGYTLLEVNRSCQFGGYLRKSSLNLAQLLNRYLLANLEL